jgi:hypothetical protein
MPQAEAKLMSLPRYAALEIERRWLVDLSALDDLDNAPFRVIEDLYVAASRLRLRKITEQHGEAGFKLGKKYGKRSGLVEPIATLYLTEGEYRQLSSLPGFSVTKRRYSIAGGSLDLYPSSHSGVAIFELEFESEASAHSYFPSKNSEVSE